MFKIATALTILLCSSNLFGSTAGKPLKAAEEALTKRVFSAVKEIGDDISVEGKTTGMNYSLLRSHGFSNEDKSLLVAAATPIELFGHEVYIQGTDDLIKKEVFSSHTQLSRLKQGERQSTSYIINLCGIATEASRNQREARTVELTFTNNGVKTKITIPYFVLRESGNLLRKKIIQLYNACVTKMVAFASTGKSISIK